MADEDGGRRAAKRQRVSQACAPCRYAKLRCDGQQPTCTTCRHQEKRCTYEASFKRRGLRSGYVRALELLWGLTFRELDKAESVVDELVGRLSKQDLTASSDRTDAATPASILLDRWKQSDVARHIDDLLNDNDEQHADGEEGGVQDGLPQLYHDTKPSWIVVRSEDRQLGLGQLGIEFPETHSDANISNTETLQLQGLSPTLQPPAYASQLLQLFFCWVQSWLPILERHVTLKTVYQYSMDASLLHYGDRSALWAVYAYTSTVLSHLLTDGHARQHAQAHCGAFYAQAFSMLPLDSDQPVELGHIQCVTLLALTRLSSGAVTAAWRLLKIATHMLQEVTERQKKAADQDVLARAWLACFILDTISSAHRQGTPSLTYNDIVRYLQVDENGVEEWQPWQRPERLQDQDSPTERTADVPTHSVGMLVLQAKLLRLPNGNLHRRSPWSQQPSGSELEEWNQALSSYLGRTGLTTVLRNKNLDLLLLPPSFTVLSILYTTLVSHSTNVTVHEANALVQTVDYPLLSRASLQALRKIDQLRKNLPALHLLSTSLGVDSPSNVVPDESNHIWQPRSGVNGLVPTFEVAQLGVQGGQFVSNMQENSAQISTSLVADVGANENRVNEHSPESGIPSIDSYMFSADGPFLEFMDELDDRSILDNDLFGKSLGFIF